MNATEAKPIVFGTDFSESATQAATVADALARHLGVPLKLVHSADERGEFPDHLRTRLMNDDRPRMAKEAAHLRSLGLTFEDELLRGAPDEGVADFAARGNARLVVVGASGTGSLWGSRWVLGNVAERIAETSAVPTLVVRAAESLLAWARGERPLKMFVAVDFTGTSDAALRWVAEWQQARPCEITLGYVHELPEECGETAMFGGLGLTRLTSQAREGLENDLREKARRLGVTATIRVEPRKARVDSHLILMATEAGADVLVLGAHQWQNLARVWHASISRRILHDAPMSLVCVPVPLAPQGAAAAIPTFSRVLVATDFSERAGHAIPYAYAALARAGAVSRAARTMGSNGLDTWINGILPASLPFIVSGIKQGWAFAWRSLMAAEIYVTILTGFGLGNLLHYGRELNAMDRGIAVMLIIVLIGLLADKILFSPWERFLHRRWGTARV